MNQFVIENISQLPDLSEDYVTTRLTLRGYNSEDLDISKLPPNLKILDIQGSTASGVPFITLPDTVTTLSCTMHNLTEFDGSLFPHLTTLHLHGGQLTSIIYPPNLIILDVTDNRLESLPPFPDSLRTLNATNNLLSELPDCTNLTWLNISECRFRTVPNVSDKLEYLSLDDCPINTLPRLPPGLKELHIKNLRIKDILLPNFLEELYMPGTQIIQVPYLPNTITVIDLSDTPITEVTNDDFPASCVNINLTNTFVKSVPAELYARANVQFVENDYENKQLRFEYDNGFNDGYMSDDDPYRQTDSPVFDGNLMQQSDTDDEPVVIFHRPREFGPPPAYSSLLPAYSKYKVTLTHVVQL